jgi:hypothetical protein
MREALVGLAIGVLALFVANLALTNFPQQIETLLAAIDLTGTIIGFITLATGLGGLLVVANANGLNNVSTTQAAAPGILAISGALLLAL